MRYTTLGSTGFQVSALCLGTMTFAREADASAAHGIYHRCREAGVNFVDCADIDSEGAAGRILLAPLWNEGLTMRERITGLDAIESGTGFSQIPARGPDAVLAQASPPGTEAARIARGGPARA